MGSRTRKSLIFAFLAAAWAVTIFPSVFFPYWAYLDDPGIIWRGSLAFEFPYNYLPNEYTGRFCPAYWLYYALIYPFSGFNLAGYYLVQSLVFLGIVGLLFLLGHRLAAHWGGGLAAALLFLTASPVAENAYTLGKPEPRILLLMLAAVAVFFFHLERPKTCRSWWRWTGIVALVLVSMLTKETTMVLAVFGAAGCGISILFRRRNPAFRSEALLWGGFFLCVLLVVAGTRGLFYLLLPENALKAYTSYPISWRLIRENFRFYIGQIPDIPILGICATTAFALAVRRFSAVPAHRIVFTGSLCATGWAYFCGMLLWRWPLGYYLLIPAGFFSATFAAAFFQLKSGGGHSRKVWILTGIILLTRVYSVPYGIYVARAQKAMDRTFTELMVEYAERAQPGQRLLVENWPFYVEPVRKSNRLLTSIWNRKNLQVEGIRDFLDGELVTPETLRLHAYAEAPEPFGRYPDEGDFIGRLTGNRNVSWYVRGVSPFTSRTEESDFTHAGGELALLTDRRYGWKSLFLSPRLPLPSLETFSAGFRLYQVLQSPFVFWESGRWQDGWIGEEAFVRLRMAEPAAPFRVQGSVPPEGIPGKLHIYRDDQKIKTFQLNKAGDFAFPLIVAATDRLGTRLRFETSRTFVPREAGTGPDDRRLGVVLDIAREPEIKWDGRWSDGWIGTEATCRVFWPGKGTTTVRFSGTAIPGRLPQRITVQGAGIEPQTVEILEAGSFQFDVSLSSETGSPGYLPLLFHAERTVNPKALGKSEDARDLSVHISAKRLPAGATQSPRAKWQGRAAE